MMQMSYIDFEQDYKEVVLKIWDCFKDIDILNDTAHQYRKKPFLPNTIQKNAILFIGLNPSLPNKEEVGSFIHPYFLKFEELADYCGEKWTHVDLLYLIETNQKVAECLSYTDVNFLSAQLDITFDIIKRIKPKVIIVVNAFASEFFGKMKNHKHSNFEKIWKGFDLDFNKDFDNNIGTYNIEIAGVMTPIFFSGMLSGKRALDLGSFERLKWQVKKVLGHSKFSD